MAGKVLFVDDEPNITESIKHILRKEKYEVLTANSAKEALQMMGKEPIDIVVSDEKMSNMSGTEMLSLIRRKHPDTIRIIMTGYPEASTATRAINEGKVYRFLTKPYNALDLVITIRRTLEHKELITKGRQLLKTVRKQSAFLEELEEKHLQALKSVRKESKIGTLGEPEEANDVLAEAMDAEINKSEKMLMDLI